MHLDLAFFQQGERLQITNSCVKSKKADLRERDSFAEVYENEAADSGSSEGRFA